MPEPPTRSHLTVAEIDRLMRDSWRTELRRLAEVMDRLAVWPWGRLWGASPYEQLPAVDVFKEDGKIVVQVGLPGAKPEEIEATIEDDVLTIRRTFKEQVEPKERAYIFREQRSSSFVRHVELPHRVAGDKTEAELRHGMLTIRLVPAEPRSKERKIEIK